MTKVIKLQNTSNEMLVDDNWFLYLNRWLWQESESGYAYRSGHDNRRIMVHRILLGNPDGVVDHIDRDRRNNQFANLRVVTRSENSWNRGKLSANRSGYIGVSLASHERYRVNVGQKTQRVHLGYFYDAVEAALVYDEFIHQERGVFAKLNFPQNVVDGVYVRRRPAGGEGDTD